MLSLGQTPALPLDDAGAYVAAAYVVFLALLIVYLGIMALRLKRVEKQMREIEAARAADPEETGRSG